MAVDRINLGGGRVPEPGMVSIIAPKTDDAEIANGTCVHFTCQPE